jgi:hypothetical protein
MPRPYGDMSPIDQNLDGHRLPVHRRSPKTRPSTHRCMHIMLQPKEGDKSSSSNTVPSAHKATAAQLTAINDMSSCHPLAYDRFTSYTRYLVPTWSTSSMWKHIRTRVGQTCPRGYLRDRVIRYELGYRIALA